jgi:hypothetical protein
MTSTPISSTRESIHIPVRPAAVATVLSTLAFVAFGTFADGSEGVKHDPMEFVVIGGLVVALAALMFLLVVPRALRSGRTANLGLGLAIGSLPFVLVFWSGIAPALAVSGILLGSAARRAGEGAGKGAAAVAVGALALLGYVAIYISDWMATNNIAGM